MVEVIDLNADTIRGRAAGASAEGDALFCRPRQSKKPLSRPDQATKTILRKHGSGAFVSAQCHTPTCWMPTNHYCRAVVATSNVSVEGKEHESICGALACMTCRSNWPGNPEDYANRCLIHKQ